MLLVVERTTTRDALQWTLGNAVQQETDHLHILTIGPPTSKLVSRTKARKGLARAHVWEGGTHCGTKRRVGAWQQRGVHRACWRRRWLLSHASAALH